MMASLHTTMGGARTAPLDLLLSTIPSLPRPVLARLTERLLEQLDELDGDCDLEDDDPAGDPLDIDGEAPTDDGRELLPMRPLYAVDQTAGPTNEDEAYRAWQMAQGTA